MTFLLLKEGTSRQGNRSNRGKIEAEKASIFLQIRYFYSTFMIHPHSTPHTQTGCPLPHLALEQGTA